MSSSRQSRIICRGRARTAHEGLSRCRRRIRRPARRRAHARAEANCTVPISSSAAWAASTWPPKDCLRCSASTIWRSSALRRSRGGSRTSSTASVRPPGPQSPTARTSWSSSTVPISPIGSRAAFAATIRLFRSWTMSRPRYGPGVRAARAPCDVMSTMCWRCFLSSPEFTSSSAVRTAPMSVIRWSSRRTSCVRARTRRTAAMLDRRSCSCCPEPRRSEIKRLIQPFRRTVERVAKEIWPLDIVVPTTPHLADVVLRETAGWPLRPTHRREARGPARGISYRARGAGQIRHRHARTWQWRGCRWSPPIGCPGIELAIARRLIRVPSVILANLVLGENVVPEFIQQDCTPEKLGDALVPLLSRHAGAAAPDRGLRPARLHHADRHGAAPARRAAEIVLSKAAQRGSGSLNQLSPEKLASGRRNGLFCCVAVATAVRTACVLC